jgi:LPPG:FO 2-phospho-L-lactate transferase
VERARIPDEVISALNSADAVLIGPSNPVTSIGPILAVDGYKELLRKKKVVAISPIIGNQPFSGPAGKFMSALGFEVSPSGVAEMYRDFIDILVIDNRDNCWLDFADVVKANTIMKKKEDAINLSEFVIEVI